ncbi:testis-expressed protein 13D [Pteronotus mesoamericanus]|uniref:testis-expressed protein 13D n=1 Tax=Pteronotus mesoamericanus TaxID=1884717 RepID=UPI0023EB284D|nr:testis-expressed protein 13D [Pteronotus parnellii mesoamericanus]
MAVNFGDFASGFRHSEVISFINNEVLSNGGGSDFYTALRSQPWNEIEDQLRAIVTDPQVPHNLKRAYTWSALALSVRVAARQREQQVPQLRWLQQRVQEREATSWVLASQLQQLCKERDQVASNLHHALATLRETVDERDMLRQRLRQVERSAQANLLPQAVNPVRRDQQRGATAWPMNAEEQGEMVTTGAHSMPHLETQMATLGAELYMPGPSSPWAQAMQPPLPAPAPAPAPHPFPVHGPVSVHAPFPVGFPYSTPLPPPPPPPVVMEAEGAVGGMAAAGAGVPQIPPLGIYPPSLCAAVETQEEMAPLSDHSCYGQCECPENLQEEYALGDSTDLNQDEDLVYSQKEYPVMPQEEYPLGASQSHSQEEGPEMLQENYPLGGSQSYSQEEGPVMPQGRNLLGNSTSHSQEEGPEMLQENYPLGASQSHSQEGGPVMPQGRNLLGNGTSHNQEEGPQVPQGEHPMGASQSHGQEEGPVMLQGRNPLGNSASHSQEGGPQVPQGGHPAGARKSHSQEGGAEMPQGASRSGAVRKCPRKQQPLGQKPGQPKGVRAPEFLYPELLAAHYNLQNWYCPWCRAVNFLWRKSCYKCKRVSMSFGNGGVDPRQTHFRKCVPHGKFAQRLQFKSASSFCPTEVKERSMSFTVEELLLFQGYQRVGGRGAFMWLRSTVIIPGTLSNSTWSLADRHVCFSRPVGVGGISPCWKP